MRSEIVSDMENISVEEKRRYSELQVLQSAAGFYIGTMYTNTDGSVEPGSRDSGYFGTKEQADEFFADVIKNNDRANLRFKP